MSLNNEESNVKIIIHCGKPSVAQQFADALKIRGRRGDGYIESDEAIVTWCVGHLVTMELPGSLRYEIQALESEYTSFSAKRI